MADESKKSGAPRQRIVRIGDRRIVTEGLSRRFWTDLNHRAMIASWPAFFVGALGIFLALNLVFAAIYALGTDPIANAPPGNPWLLFFFSVETLATVGYGDMHPQTIYAHVVATVQIFTGMSLIAVMTGLVFSRFSRPRARFVFAKRVVIGQHDGRQTLMIRLANARQNTIAGATARLWLLTTEQTIEGRPYRRYRELKLIRNENPTFALSWTMFHVIDQGSAMSGITAEQLEALDANLLLTVTGLDEQSVQHLYARKTYSHRDIGWGQHYVDILTSLDDGQTHIDYNKLNDTELDGPLTTINAGQ